MTAANRGKRQKPKGKPQKPHIKIPSTPNSASKGGVSAASNDKDTTSQEPQSSLGSAFQTPPTSPSSPVIDLPSMESMTQQSQEPQEKQPPQEQVNVNPAISATDIASNDILAIANVFATMKTALVSMTSAFDRLGTQTEKMMSLSLDIKAAEQLRQVQSTLEQQIIRHKAEIQTLRSSLQAKIKEAVEEKIRAQMYDIVKSSIQQEVEEKVREQLSVQIPEDLRQQVISHKRQILEVKTTLHNSEARRYNALQTIPGPNARLRPLLRPLPTPEQSPVILVSQSSSVGGSTLATPTSAFPRVPAPTPIKRIASNSLRSALPETVPPTPSHLFPRDLGALFALSQDDARRLLREYGLDSAAASPATENAKPRGLASVDEEGDALDSDGEKAGEEDPDAHAKYLNTFMAHIGVPFLMIPAPKEKVDESAPLSSRSRRRRLLTPLIIK
ncbi:hypothetical protein GALMADRAFT_226392 [Galerina marginata CBS 339.88]|uniref:Uncharacterized protein n=1 Tax=Galerina marginata (strain CBS 339.88) TaxID=685588 RepID=A0A067SXX2_GALM3|nr:hypothetical protein GALMADRAFT_226392 [Galerina marginata CBS 339.88]